MKNIWTLEQLQDKEMPQTCINGKWVAARPLNYTCRSLIERIQEAWYVFIGRTESFTWPENQ